MRVVTSASSRFPQLPGEYGRGVIAQRSGPLVVVARDGLRRKVDVVGEDVVDVPGSDSGVFRQRSMCRRVQLPRCAQKQPGMESCDGFGPARQSSSTRGVRSLRASRLPS